MKRLLEESSSEFEKSLLSAGREEEPPADAADRTLAALGLGTVAAGAALGAGTAGAVKLGWLGSAKLVAGLALVSGVVVGGSYWVMDASSPSSAVSPTASDATLGVQSSAPVRADARPVRIVPNPATAQEVGPPGAVSAPSSAALSSSVVARSAPSTPGSRVDLDVSPSASAERLGEETKLLDQARDALRANDADACLARLDAYRSRFPKGQLAADAAGLRRMAEAKKKEKSQL